MTTVEALKTYFMESSPHMWTRDIREPSYTFEFQGQEWGLYLTNVVGWVELLAFSALQGMLVTLLSAFVYKMILQKQGTWIAYLSCFTIAMPALYLIPLGMFYLLNIRNQFFRFCIGTIIPVTCLFKTTTTAFGFAPKYATTSLKAFAFYYSVPLPMERSEKLDKYEPNSVAEVVNQLTGFVQMFIAMGFMITFYSLIPDIMPPMGLGEPPAEYYTIADIFKPKSQLRNFLYLWFMCPLVTSCGYGFMAAQNVVTGVKACSVMDNPFFTTRSYTMFWGGKWNLMIHQVLKSGVYLPVRKYFPKHIAMLSTFAASGLFHEALLWMFMLPLDDSNKCWSDPNARHTTVDCYLPRPFTTSLFFLWHAGGIAVEYSPLVKHATFWDSIPTPICSVLLIASGSVLAHYFTEPYWNSLCFENAMVLFTFAKPL
ncbi:long-chain-alcohol O-fatty-acyltransferase [Seminavis robusta]|uniref:Long-chain-alcohol O-fatty-acyltransferase n=1 Tax=Seminavis robusta TaxID=568900 RepID=A0A9N8ETX8_9STRA|nr:long-chain-alcohol O-fatty-acyltransferase [Seminavis robusta]|eukprot:Sro1676_g290480.1 long-chain-alcohol O-fatty-acyltransferase (427) ;mRNA; f:9733-11108